MWFWIPQAYLVPPLWYQCPSINNIPMLLLVPLPLCQGWVVLRPTITFFVSSKHCYKSPLVVLPFFILSPVLGIFHCGTTPPPSSEPSCGVKSSMFQVSWCSLFSSFLLPSCFSLYRCQTEELLLNYKIPVLGSAPPSQANIGGLLQRSNTTAFSVKQLE